MIEEVSRLNTTEVLILVLMEDALRAAVTTYQNALDATVLILVLMEDALRAEKELSKDIQFPGLNPCSNGRCSASI